MRPVRCGLAVHSKRGTPNVPMIPRVRAKSNHMASVATVSTSGVETSPVLHTYHYSHIGPIPLLRRRSLYAKIFDLQVAKRMGVGHHTARLSIQCETQQLTDDGRDHLLWIVIQGRLNTEWRTCRRDCREKQAGQMRVDLIEQSC